MDRRKVLVLFYASVIDPRLTEAGQTAAHTSMAKRLMRRCSIPDSAQRPLRSGASKTRFYLLLLQKINLSFNYMHIYIFYI